MIVEELRTAPCLHCQRDTSNLPNDDSEIVCDDCEQNAAEAAYGRYCEAFHDGGALQFRSLEQQRAEARRFK